MNSDLNSTCLSSHFQNNSLTSLNPSEAITHFKGAQDESIENQNQKTVNKALIHNGFSHSRFRSMQLLNPQNLQYSNDSQKQNERCEEDSEVLKYKKVQLNAKSFKNLNRIEPNNNNEIKEEATSKLKFQKQKMFPLEQKTSYYKVSKLLSTQNQFIKEALSLNQELAVQKKFIIPCSQSKSQRIQNSSFSKKKIEILDDKLFYFPRCNLNPTSLCTNKESDQISQGGNSVISKHPSAYDAANNTLIMSSNKTPKGHNLLEKYHLNSSSQNISFHLKPSYSQQKKRTFFRPDSFHLTGRISSNVTDMQENISPVHRKNITSCFSTKRQSILSSGSLSPQLKRRNSKNGLVSQQEQSKVESFQQNQLQEDSTQQMKEDSQNDQKNPLNDLASRMLKVKVKNSLEQKRALKDTLLSKRDSLRALDLKNLQKDSRINVIIEGGSYGNSLLPLTYQKMKEKSYGQLAFAIKQGLTSQEKNGPIVCSSINDIFNLFNRQLICIETANKNNSDPFARLQSTPQELSRRTDMKLEEIINVIKDIYKAKNGDNQLAKVVSHFFDGFEHLRFIFFATEASQKKQIPLLIDYPPVYLRERLNHNNFTKFFTPQDFSVLLEYVLFSDLDTVRGKAEVFLHRLISTNLNGIAETVESTSKKIFDIEQEFLLSKKSPLRMKEVFSIEPPSFDRSVTSSTQSIYLNIKKFETKQSMNKSDSNYQINQFMDTLAKNLAKNTKKYQIRSVFSQEIDPNIKKEIVQMYNKVSKD